MSVQLILFPQYYDGANPLIVSNSQFIIDGINFATVNSSNSQTNVLPPTTVNAISSLASMTVNTWYRFSSSPNFVIEASGSISLLAGTGIMQKLSNLTVGVSYDVTIIAATNTLGFFIKQFNGNIQQSTSVFSGTGVHTFTFTAASSNDIITFFSSGVTIINSITVQQTPQANTGVTLENGQVICDLYEDEDIPLTLSVDDFKNVAEKVQSYSKAFNLPATKRNNQIFDSIFEVTRTDTGLNFNPYKKTQCVLKQDGFILFEGYLRLIDIQDKEGEISYDVNLYSEVVALADVLKDRTFSDLDFTELEHEYNLTNIQATWGVTGVTYLNASTSGFRSAATVKYPFVDWNHQIYTGSSNFPVLPNLETAFRPFIKIKYLIDRIFADSPFTYTSDFFDTADFKKLYMDFNWGGDNTPTQSGTTTFIGTWRYQWPLVGTIFTNYANTTYSALDIVPFTLWSVLSEVPPNYNTTNNIITATADGETYVINYSYTVENIDTGNRTVDFRWLHNTTPINVSSTITLGTGDTYTYSGTLTRILSNGDTLVAQFKSDDATGTKVRQYQDADNVTSSVTFAVNISAITSNTFLQTLRGELGQWEFLKGLMTMFNLVSLPDKDNPTNILIEPYADVFIENDDSTQLDWTDKIDVTEMKLTPLTDLNKKTIFKFVEDDDDYAFNVYKNSVGGHLYGSKKQDEVFYTILDGEKEIVAEPFAATVPKALMSQFSDFITPAIYARGSDDTWEGVENSPRIMYDNGEVTLTSCTYYIPAQNGVGGSAFEDEFLQFSHLSDIPAVTSAPPLLTDTVDFHFGICQTLDPINIGNTANNLYNMYWSPYYNELYNPDTRTMTIKVNLNPSDINTFNFYDTILIKNREYRVNKIDYKPNDLATVEFILIP